MGDAPRLRISIFLSVFDVHINRTPVGGKVKKIVYTPGLFLNADLDKASQDNGAQRAGDRLAGWHRGLHPDRRLIARRILCFVREGEELAPGARFGLIRFGSRTDIYLPEGAQALVSEGQRAIGGKRFCATFPRKSRRAVSAWPEAQGPSGMDPIFPPFEPDRAPPQRRFRPVPCAC